MKDLLVLTKICQESKITSWIFPKFAIVVRIGAKPLSREIMITLGTSERTEARINMTTNMMLRMMLVLIDLMAVFISALKRSISLVSSTIGEDFSYENHGHVC